jgi:hypothetical protein
MKKRLAMVIAAVAWAAACLGATASIEPMLNAMLNTYPGAARVQRQDVDTYYLGHGWLTWQAAYQSPDDLDSVLRWYAAQLPQADLHENGACFLLRQSQSFIHSLHTVSVLLCPLRPGTRINLSEEVFLAP